MKHFTTLFFLTTSLLLSAQTWVKIDTFPGEPRYGAVSFVINGKAYVGMGEAKNSGHQIDFYEFDPATGKWTRKADFPGPARFNPVSFANSTKGFVALGFDDHTPPSHIWYKDVWSYTPATDTWKQEADFPGSPRRGALAFSIGNSAYVGAGRNSSHVMQKDIYKYNMAVNIWSSVVDNAAFEPRENASAFAIGTKGYVVSGNDEFNAEFSDVWEFSGTTWTKKIPEDYQNFKFSEAPAFVLNNEGYICYGKGVQYITKYKPSDNTFQRLDDPLGLGKFRYSPTAFVLNGKAYLGLGLSGPTYNNDFWVLDPTISVDETGKESDAVQLQPSIGDGNFYLKIENATAGNLCDLEIFSISGSRTVAFEQLQNGQKIDLRHLPDGIWLARFTIDSRSFVQKIVIQN